MVISTVWLALTVTNSSFGESHFFAGVSAVPVFSCAGAGSRVAGSGLIATIR